MRELFPIIFVIILVITLTNFSKGKSKGGKTPGSGLGPTVKQPSPAVREPSDRNSASARPLASGSLSAPAPLIPEPMGGSLSMSYAEGTDPCHDDLRAMPLGSLSYQSTEGTDPCHDEWTPAAPTVVPEESSRPAPAGLNLSWTGSDLVKGLVYSEILKRKVG